ncbi:hypothetical protein BD408DRAFT_382525 [Parasitella parasitica]|nr:hypothetical protein BD408DRAFT_382525 [Parasitella parasitica]
MYLQIPKGTHADFFTKSPFTKCVEMYIKEANRRTKYENQALLTAIKYATKIKQELIQDRGVDFDGSQFMFCLPPEWTGKDCETAIRALYLDAGWITEDDAESRLLFSTYTESFVGYLQLRQQELVNLERERRYVLGYIGDNVLKVTCFQMQSANELITASQSLAASDFLLVPTTLDEELMCQLTFDSILRTASKRIVIKRIIDGLKSRIYYRKRTCCSRPRRNTKHFKKLGVQNIINTFASQLSDADYLNLNDLLLKTVKWKPVDWDVVAVKKLFKGWTWNDLTNEIFKSADLKQLLQQFTDACKRIHNKYNSSRGSPEGIQSIFLYTMHRNVLQKRFMKPFKDALSCGISANCPALHVYDRCENYIFEGAMQKPYKIIQIANAQLPPLIWDENIMEKNDLLIQDSEMDLMPSNSFYLQAYIYETCIEFILNKAVAVSLVNGVAQKSIFTAQKKKVCTETIADSVCKNVWSHLEMMDFEDCRHGCLRECCSGELSIKNYQCFQDNVRKLSSKWLRCSDIFTNQNLDNHQQISISNDCECRLNISTRLLIEVGIKPAIGNLATIIASTLASNSFFGRYNVSVLIVINGYDDKSSSILKQVLQKRLQIHQKKTVLFLGEQELMSCKSLGAWAVEKEQILGEGSYMQLSDTNYVVRFYTTQDTEENKVYEYNGYSFRKIKMMRGGSESIVLRQAEHLDHKGVHTSFIFKDVIPLMVELYTQSISQDGQTFYHRIWCYENVNIIDNKCPFIIRIIPQHYSSTVNFEFSSTSTPFTDRTTYSPLIDSRSINMRQKLVLKQQ